MTNLSTCGTPPSATSAFRKAKLSATLPYRSESWSRRNGAAHRASTPGRHCARRGGRSCSYSKWVLLLLKAKPLSMNTPLPAESTGSQSTSCCSLKSDKLQVALNQANSGGTLSENAQHGPTAPSMSSPQHPHVVGRRTHELLSASGHSTHGWAHTQYTVYQACPRFQVPRQRR